MAICVKNLSKVLFLQVVLLVTQSVSELSVGQTCTANPTDCVSGAECDGGTCKLSVGQTCTANPTDCVSGAECDGGTCRISVGQSCRGNTENCVSGTVCNKISVGQTCTENPGNCVNGSVCDSGVCKISAGSSLACNGNSSVCVTTAMCDNSGDRCRTRVKETCPQGSSVCQSGTQCVNTGTSTYQCRITAGSSRNCNSDPTNCVLTATCETNTCKTKLNQPCFESRDHCQSGTKCVSVGSNYQCKRQYGETCTANNECQNSNNQDCLNQRCLCSVGYFRQKTTNTCKNVNLLVAGNVRRNGGPAENSISVEWDQPSALMGAAANYRANVTGSGESSAWDTNLFASFSNLTAGTQYTITVTTRTKKDPDYGQQTVEVTTTPGLVLPTKPAVPGKLVSGQVYAVPTVIMQFFPSNGHVDTYYVTVNGNTVNVPNNQGTLQASFTIQQAERTYTVTIVAHNHGLASDSQTDNFYVDAARAGPVDQLTAPSHGGRWSRVTWQKPSMPNGDIQGYTVKALVEGTMNCVSGVAVLCSDCTYTTSDISTIPSVVNCTTKSSINKTKSELNTNNALYVNVTGLQPDVKYRIRVNAYNVKGLGINGDTSVTTDQEAALSLKSVTVTPSAPHQLEVRWTPDERTGNTTYTVSWSEKESLTSNSFVFNDSMNITGYTNTVYTITGLLSYWQYEVSVFPFTPVTDPPAGIATKNGLTLPSKPGPLASFTFTQPDDSAQKLMLTASCPEEKQRNGDITHISYTSIITQQVQGVSGENSPDGDIAIRTDCTVSAEIPVVAETTYNFTVFAKTSGDDGNASTKEVSILPKPPKLVKPPVGELVAEKSSTTNSVTLEVCRCMVSADQGHIVLAGITVCAQSASDDCQPASGKQRISKYEILPTWKQIKQKTWSGRYRPTSNDFLAHIAETEGTSRRKKRAAANSVLYTIGENTTCDELDESVFCNGPLPEDRTFNIIIWACTKAGCMESPDFLSVKTGLPGDGQPTVVIIAVVVAVLVVFAIIVAVVVVVIFRIRRSHQTIPRRRDIDLEERLHNQKSISLLMFSARIAVLHRNSDFYFAREYQKLLAEEQKYDRSCHVGKLEIHSIKNRCAEIVPYDHTRVKLYSRDDQGQDYINASYVQGIQSPCDYLATQAPLLSTIPDFWKMVYEHHSSIIVMLTDFTEHGQSRADHYWPRSLNHAVQYGDVSVTMTTMSVLPHYTVRTFSVHTDEQDSLTVSHFQLVWWEDQGTCLSLDDLVDVLCTVGEKTTYCDGPVTVHCSDGTCRTSSFIALDTLRRHVARLQLGEALDVFSILLDILKCRPHMMQTQRQYMFIHDVVQVMVERKMRNELRRRAEYGNAQFRDSTTYDSTYSCIADERVYDVLDDVKQTAGKK